MGPICQPPPRRFSTTLKIVSTPLFEVILIRGLSTKASWQSTLGYTHGSSLSVDGAQATNSMVTQDTDKVFIQVRPPCGRNTYVLRLIVLCCENNVS